MNLRDLKLRARALLRPSHAEQDLRDELSFHLERETKKLIDEGLDPVTARQMAQSRFGSPALAADECRDERGTAFVDNTIGDIQYALRSFRRTPLASLTIVVTVAIGLGVVAVLFTVLNTMLFRVDQVPDVRAIYAVERSQLSDGGGSLFTRPRFEALRAETAVFTDAYATQADIDLRVDGRVMAVTLVTANFFQVVDVAAVMGRTLTPADDDRSGGNPVLVLSDKGWRRRFNRAPDVLGRTVLVNGAPFEIVGLMPEGFRGLEVSGPDFWAPLARLADFKPASRGAEDKAAVEIVGRLKPGISMQSARAQVAAWDANQSAGGVDERTMSIELVPRRGTVPNPLEAIALFTPLFLAFGLVLLIGCANVGQPLARARCGAAERDRDSTLTRSLAPPHRPPAADGKHPAGAGCGRRRLPGLTAGARGRGLLGDADHAARSWRRQPRGTRCRLARRDLPGAGCRGRDRVLRTDAGATGDADRPGADDPG